jgi:hypothetical protein
VRAAATRAVAAANTSDLARYTRARDIEAAQRELTAEPWTRPVNSRLSANDFATKAATCVTGSSRP